MPGMAGKAASAKSQQEVLVKHSQSFAASDLSRQPCSQSIMPAHKCLTLLHLGSAAALKGFALTEQTCSLADGLAGVLRFMLVAITGYCSQPKQAPTGQCCNTQVE